MLDPLDPDVEVGLKLGKVLNFFIPLLLTVFNQTQKQNPNERKTNAFDLEAHI